jgi:hypothetical protein
MQWFVVLNNEATTMNSCSSSLVIAEPFGAKKGEPFSFAHEYANKGKKNDEKYDKRRKGSCD